MMRKTIPTAVCLVYSIAGLCADAKDENQKSWAPFHLPYETPDGALSDARFLLDPPAGKHGRITVRDGHFHFSNGKRARFWGTNLSGEGCFPPKEMAPRLADRLARFGFNLVRFHGLDARWGQTLFDKSYADTQHFDEQQLDRVNYLIAQLEERGIYVNINLHVGRKFTEADGVPQANWLAYSKYCTIFDPRMIELQKKYAKQLLTHRNPYTGKTYADDPAVIIVELTNENSLFGGWVRGQLRGKQDSRPVSGWADIPPYYGEELTRFYNAWLAERYPSRKALQQAWGKGSRSAGKQLLRNGDFTRNTEGWKLSQRKPAAASLEISNEDPPGRPCAKVIVSEVTDTPWHIMLTQRPLSLRKGNKYRVAFSAAASSPRSLSVEVCRSQPYKGYGSNRFELQQQWRECEFTFVAPENDDGVRLSFHLGDATGTDRIAGATLHEAPIFGLGDDEHPEKETVRRLDPEQFQSCTEARFRDEGRFYFDLERRYYGEIYGFLKRDLGVKALIEGTNHNYGLPSLRAQSLMDLMDCHAYWQHPSFPNQPWSRTDWRIGNSPMLDQPDRTTIAALSRSSVLGKPFTVSEYNHPFPSEYACEAPLLMAAYACLQDWDAVYFYTFGHRWRERELSGNEVTGYFDICNEATKMVQMPIAALMFLRGDVRPARRLVTIQYDENRLFDSLKERRWGPPQFFTVGELSPLLPLVHRFRVERFDAGQTTRASDIPFEKPAERIQSDTGELVWNTNGDRSGQLTINTPRLQTALGWLAEKAVDTADVSFRVRTPFCAVSLAAMDGKPLRRSGRILVVAAARCANSGMTWNEERNSIGDRWGGPPLLIESVEGEILLRRDLNAPPLRLIPLDGRGLAKGKATRPLKKGAGTFAFPLRADDATLWYFLSS